MNILEDLDDSAHTRLNLASVRVGTVLNKADFEGIINSKDVRFCLSKLWSLESYHVPNTRRISFIFFRAIIVRTA